MTAKPANNDNDNTHSNHKNPSPPPSLCTLFQKTKRFVLRPMGLTSIILLLSVLATVFVLSQTLNLATTTTSHPIDRRGAEEQHQEQHQERSVINRIHTHQDDYINTDLTEDNTEMTQNKDNNNNNDEPNPPIWPPSIQIFTPPQTPSEKQSILTTISKTSDTISQDPNTPPYQTYTSQKHFTNERHALLFTPGTYTELDFEVGYYVQVLGLGTKASDVVFTDCDKGPFVPSLERLSVRPPWGLGLDTFWRAAENFKTEARGGMHWIVSQAAPLRRVHVDKQKVRKHDDTNGTLIKDDNDDDEDKSGSLFLGFGDAYVSGGVFANGIVEGKTDFVGQQQWISRNVEFRGEAVGGAWSLVFVGCTEGEANNNKGLRIPKASAGLDGGKSVTVEEQPNVRVEKPYIALGEDGISFALRVPRPTWGEDAIGPDLEGETDDVRDFKRVKVAVPSEEQDPILAAAQNTATLQKALDEEKDLVLSPGIYPLQTSLKVKHPNQVVLGLGLATLVAPTDGSPCLRVMPNTPGVRIAGIMLEASKQDVEQNFNPEMRDCPDGIASLLEWGHPDDVKTDAGDAKNPGVLTDIFARVGGSNPDRSVSTDVMVRIHSSHVVGDNLWLWRADHVQLLPGEEANYPANPKDPNSKLPRVSDHYHQVTKDECKCATGLIVNGDDVTIHGLAVEHTEEHLTIWNGERGNVRFYQSELPYDVSHASFGAKGYTGYMVGDDVKEHDAQAVGVYSNFRDYVVKVDTAIRHPMVEVDKEEEEGGGGVKKKRKLQNGADSLSSVSTGMIRNPFTVHLDNFGRIMSIVNGKGAEAEEGKGPARVKEETVFDEDENDR